MPRLIVLNGPPGCGKSTLAARYVDDHPLALNVDIDLIRGQIGCWRENSTAAGLLARAIALAAARTHLAAGHDVIIPQFLAHAVFLDQVQHLATDMNADFREIILLDTKENVIHRFTERATLEATPAELSTMYDKLMSLIAIRPEAVIVTATGGQIDQTYRDFVAGLD